ncbi:MAG TPA: hypothetical protein VFL80_08300 [Thermoanaerobaculia bacterium]|nr:hypothetical protein [Thermoanaerobaculia bacterium]
MRKNRVVSIAMMALLVVAIVGATACKTSGTAVTSRGQVLKLNLVHPTDLPEAGEDNFDVVISNRGINNVQNVLLDVEIPPQLVVLDQTNERGVEVLQRGPSLYSFSFGNIQPTESSTIRFRVRTAFGTMSETSGVKATAWQKDLPGDKLVETAVIKLRR